MMYGKLAATSQGMSARNFRTAIVVPKSMAMMGVLGTVRVDSGMAKGNTKEMGKEEKMEIRKKMVDGK